MKPWLELASHEAGGQQWRRGLQREHVSAEGAELTSPWHGGDGTRLHRGCPQAGSGTSHPHGAGAGNHAPLGEVGADRGKGKPVPSLCKSPDPSKTLQISSSTDDLAGAQQAPSMSPRPGTSHPLPCPDRSRGRWGPSHGGCLGQRLGRMLRGTCPWDGRGGEGEQEPPALGKNTTVSHERLQALS